MVKKSTLIWNIIYGILTIIVERKEDEGTKEPKEGDANNYVQDIQVPIKEVDVEVTKETTIEATTKDE